MFTLERVQFVLLNLKFVESLPVSLSVMLVAEVGPLEVLARFLAGWLSVSGLSAGPVDGPGSLSAGRLYWLAVLKRKSKAAVLQRE